MQRSFGITLIFNDVLKDEPSCAPRTLRASIARCLGALLVSCLVARLGYAAGGADVSSETSSPALPSSPTGSQFIVIGFLGGFVAHDEPHHPEVHMIQKLRQEYPKDAYFGLFENTKIEEAYRIILKRLDANQDGILSDYEKHQACIKLFGHSWGGSAAVALARKLERKGIPVRLTVQVDSVRKPFHNDKVIPSNVLQAANFYQRHGLIHGQSKIIAADPSHTTILGNFRWEHKQEPVECRDFPWHARFFTKAHIQIECDPRVWSQVETLLRGQLPMVSVNQTDSPTLETTPAALIGVAARKP